MNIIAVDDERAALYCLERVVKGAAGDADFTSFLTAREALEYARGHDVDVAFLDVEMPGMNGLALAKALKDIRGQTNIIFVSGHHDYMDSAFRLRASGYLLKPADEAGVLEELENLRYPVAPELGRGVRIQCFGNFEVFVDEVPVAFRRPKAKEALAYLVDRSGAAVSKKELAAVLWENQPYSRSLQSHLYKLVREMVRALRDAGAGDIVIIRRGYYALDISRVCCDYYSFNSGHQPAINSYRGEYMSNYSWAEFTTGLLTERM